MAVCDPLVLTQVTDTLSPGLCDLTAVPRVSAEVTDDPPTLVMTEPFVMPAEAAGVPDRGAADTSAPELTLRPSCEAPEASMLCTATPRYPTWPYVRSAACSWARIRLATPTAALDATAWPGLAAAEGNPWASPAVIMRRT